MGAFLDAFQKVADLANNSHGAYPYFAALLLSFTLLEGLINATVWPCSLAVAILCLWRTEQQGH